jgi:nitroreductase
MEPNNLYPAIFKRKSVRNYDLTPLNEDTLNKIREHIIELKPLYPDIKTELKIISTEDVNRRIMKKAPHYLAVFSENKEGYMNNVGYMGQQMDLYLSAKGIGSCWQGIPTVKKEVIKSTSLKFIILLAFGKAKEPLHRSDISEFNKRKKIPAISNAEIPDEFIEAVRLAPSATNQQPWFLTGDDKMINVYSVKSGILKGFMTGKYIPIDLGIALCHLQIAAEHFGKNTEIMSDKTAENNSPKNMEYVASLKME